MGWKKWIKRTVKKVTKPVTKVFKGVAKGIAKVGKSVMRGVAKLNKKLGPLGMIAMSIAMPYALQGLSNIVGSTGGPWGQATGLLGRPEGTFLKAVDASVNKTLSCGLFGPEIVGTTVDISNEMVSVNSISSLAHKPCSFA